MYQTTGATISTTLAAELQLAGLSGPNVADLRGASPDGTFNLITINFDDDLAGVGRFPLDNAIPGYPGLDCEQNFAFDNIVVESMAYVDLAAGLVTLGVTSDDGFKVTVGGDPRDVTVPIIGEFNGSPLPPFHLQ